MSRSLRPVVIVGVVALLVVAGIAIWLAVRDGEPNGDGQPPVEGPKVADPRALIEQKNVALGLLENTQPAEAVPAFEKITAQVPGDPLGPQNLAVASLLAAKEVDRTREAERHEAALVQAETALMQLRETGDNDAVVHVLAARVAAEQGRPADAMERLRRAATQKPDEAWIWFELSQLALEADDPEVRQLGEEALQKAFELQPDNLFLLVQWMRHVASELNGRLADLRRAAEPEKQAIMERIAADHANLAERLQTARQTIEPFAASIREFTRVDPLQFLDQAIEAARQNQWETVPRLLSTLANVLVRETSVDRSRVERHPLEFVVLDFQPAFYEANEIEPADTVEPISVELARVPTDEWLPADFQERVAGVTDLELADFDLDGRLDLFVLAENAVRVLGRTDGETWSVVAQAEVPAGMRGLRIADLDLDFDETEAAAGGPPDPEAVRNGMAAACLSADVDVVVYGTAGMRMFVNKFDAQAGGRSLQPAEDTGLNDLGDIRTAALLDLDSDGDLDLVLATQDGLSVWSNRGNLSFLEISDRSQLPPPDFQAEELLPVDWDRDVDLDLIVAGQGGVGVLENLRHGRLRWRPFEDEFEAPASTSAVTLVDADANASWDLLVGGPYGILLIQTRTPASGVVRQLSTTRVSGEPVDSLSTWDYDNDGVLDILAWSNDSVRVLRGLAGGTFEPVDLIESPSQPVQSIATGDFDADGDLDLVLAAPKELVLLRNEGGNKNHWIKIALQAQQVKGADPSASGRVNAHGLGSLLEVRAGARYLPRVVREQTTHIGLGQVERPDIIRVLWPNGIPRNVIRPEADQFICEQQVLLGSCPYLYTWDGEKFTFITDLLWAAPIGLQFAEGVLAPAREWEYLKVPGEMLVPRDGEYVIQITEELWEAGYFDEVKLIAVDHPADVEIFSNEKVGPAEIAEFKVHTVRERRLPVSARDHRSRDVLPRLAREDGVYLKAFDRKLRQGLTEDHYIELDLGELDDPRQITLFLTGWVYPTDTAINVALSQNPDLPSPRPPSLWAPDADGQWREVRPYMGFPGGKTKTIAVDLSDVFSGNDYRVRIATNMEFYWDAAFFTLDEPPGEFRLTDLDLLGADLHYRGFSRYEHRWDNAPDAYYYDDVSTAPQWPPIAGRFTRFGDVTELVRESDDRLVVMGPGDEMTLRVAVPDEPLPDGWTRDFLLYNVGWDKDFNLNTVLGQTVEPLPFRGMSRYPWPPDEPTPDSPEYREYLREYQTRELDQRFWRVIRGNSSGNPAGHSP